VTHEESLQIIQEMIGKARNKVTDDGFHFILWGILIITASLVNYIFIKSGSPNIANLAWVIMPLIGAPFAIIYERRKKKITWTQTHNDKITGYVWLSFGITLALTVFIAISNACSPIPYILVLVGLASFVTGRIISYLPFTLGGIVFWISAIACLAVAYPEQLLINALAIFIGYILPGIAIWRKYKNQERVQTIKSAS
jgi:hypothetical protein